MEEEFDRKILRSIRIRNPHLLSLAHRWKTIAVTVWIIVFTATTLGILEYTINTRKANCARIGAVLVSIIGDGDGELGTPGSPGYAYYKMHPQELAAAHRDNARLQKRLDPRHCK